MNVTSPKVMWLQNRCYRLNNQTNGAGDDGDVRQNNEYREDCLYGSDDEDYDIETVENGRFQTSLHVPNIFYGKIIGARGCTKSRLEKETKTQIRIPKQGENGDIVIAGSHRPGVVSARHKIEQIVKASRNKQKPTHFISIPCNVAHVMRSFEVFKNAVLAGYGNRGIDESLFQDARKLHLTFNVIALMDNTDRSVAAELLADCHDTIVRPIVEQHGQIELHLAGVKCFDDEQPQSAHILFACVQSEPLQLMADQIAERYVQKGLSRHERSGHIQFHVTLLNSVYRSHAIAADEAEPERKQPFNAADIIAEFERYDFGRLPLTEIHLSIIGSKADNGAYQATKIIQV